MNQKQKIPFSFSEIPDHHEKVITLGSQVFLIGKDFVSKKKETLYSENYSLRKSESAEPLHLSYYGSFTLKERPLSVEASHYLGYGPLGERINLKVNFHNTEISNYRFLRSYMGGGANGKWPAIIKKNWQVVFVLESLKENPGIHRFSIIYFETLTSVDSANRHYESGLLHIKKEALSDHILKNNYSLDEIRQNQKTSWKTDVPDDTSGISGVLRCRYFEGYQRYYQDNPFNFSDKEDIENSFISHSLNNRDFLYVIEYEQPGNILTLFPWPAVSIISPQNNKNSKSILNT